MKIKESAGRKIFNVFNILFLGAVALTCLLPFMNILAISFSNSAAAAANEVKFWPVGFNVKSYAFAIGNPAFLKSFGVAFLRLLIGVPINMILMVLVAYPLSKPKREFRARNFYVWFFLITVLFNAGTVPWFLTIKAAGLLDTIWALVIPGSLPVFNMIILMNFFRGLPKEIEEAAYIDGAGHWATLFKIYLPLSVPSLATVMLFSIVNHWNSWFDGMMLMNSPDNYPLQTYLRTVVIDLDTMLMIARDNPQILGFVNERTSRSAQMFISLIPIFLIYPFLQKYFTTGLVMGSVKG